jgi:membrane associated rhomboid family serine protease
LGGFGTWLIGSPGSTIGASGLIFGWLTFLIVFGFFTRKVWQIVVGVVVLIYYGTVFFGILPGTPGVSWQGHLCGAIAGAFAAYLLSAPERKAREARKRGPANPYLTS